MGGVVEFGLGAGEVGPGVLDIAGLHGLAIEDGFFADDGFDGGDEVIEGGGVVAAEVIDAVAVAWAGGGAVVEGGEDAGEDIVDVGVIAAGGAVAEDGDGFFLVDELHEFGDSQIRALSWAEDGEESEAGDGEAMEVVVGVADEFACFFGGGVGADGVIDVIGFGEGGFGVIAVDAGGGGEEELGGAGGDGGVEEVDGAVEVDGGVVGGVFDAGADAGHGGEVDDGVGVVLGEGFEDGVSVADVDFDELETRVGHGGGDVGAFLVGVVEVAEVIEADDG